MRYGPFSSMRLPEVSSWFDGDRAAKLLGTYESNLHPSLLRAIARAPRAVINIGCAEGFYAVGLALRMPTVQVFASDIDPRAIETCQECASLNGVADQVTVGGLCTSARLSELIGRSTRVLLFLDCEGAELDILDPAKVPQLTACDIIVETHEFKRPGVTELIIERLRPSHDLERVPQGARDPNSIPEIAHWRELDRWLIVNEGRPESMTWLACWTKAASEYPGA